jgi:ribonuclease III family protein
MDKDYMNLKLSANEINGMSSLALAHMGDAVYELLVRGYLCQNGRATSGGLHNAAIKHVSARAQARAAERLLPSLSEDERRVFLRGRNAHVNSVPKNAEIVDYHLATALETLFGWLYLYGENGRISELFDIIMTGA